MPAQDTYRSNTPRPRQQQQPPTGRAGASRPGPKPELTPEQKLLQELTFSISLQRLRESVEHGWKCIWYQQNDLEIEGYLAGIDREYFIVFEPYEDSNGEHLFREHLTSRGLNLDIVILPENTFEEELAHPLMVPRVEAFRHWILRGQSKGPAAPVATPSRTGTPAQRDVSRNWTPHPGTTERGPVSPMFRGA